MQKASKTFDRCPEYSMSPVRAVTPYQYPPTTYIQNPGCGMCPSHPQTYMPRPPAWPYQPWGENMPSMFSSYQGAPYFYSSPQYIPAPHQMTPPQMPYNMTPPQSMLRTTPYSSFSHPMTHLNTMPQAPWYTSPYQYPTTHPQTVTQRPQYMGSPLFHMPPPPIMPNCKVNSPEIKDVSNSTKGKYLMIDRKTSECSENSNSEASESCGSEDENSEGDNDNKSEELNNESSNENVSDAASESNSLKDVEIEAETRNITQEITDTKESSELKGDNYPLKSKCTKRKTSKKKQKKKSVKKDKGSSISKETSPVTNVSQSMENKKELEKLKEVKNFLAQYEAVITEVHCTMGKLQTQSGTEYYFPSAVCFLYGVSLARVELWHVLIEGQRVKVTLDLTSPANPKITRVTVKDEEPDHDTTTTVLDLEKWCSANSVPEKATTTLIEQVKGLHDS